MNTAEIRRNFLKQVEQAVCTDRTVSHGQPEDNFNNIATLWTAWLRGRHKVDLALDRVDVGYMSILLKTARAMSNPRYLDHALDTAGYAACIAGILGAEPKLEAPVSPRPSPEKTFKPTHVHRSKGYLVQLGAHGDGLVTYFNADGLAWTLTDSEFDCGYLPVSEPPAPPRSSPEKEESPAPPQPTLP